MQDRIIKSILFTITILLISNLALAQQNKTDEQGRKQGAWVKYKDGVKAYEGQFVDDVPVGEFLRYFRSGRLLSKSQYSAGGTRCFVEFFYDQRKSKTKAKGLYVNQVKDSLWLLYNDLGVLIAEETYEDGLASGLWKLYAYNGVLASETPYQLDQLHGIKKEYFDNGHLKREMSFQNDALQGSFKVYFPKGQLRTGGQFEMGMKAGIWTYYLIDGQVWFKETYKDGMLIERVDIEGEPYELPHVQDSVKVDFDPDKIMDMK